MRFLVDECTGPVVAKWLRDQGQDVFSVFEEARGMGDNEIVEKAHNEDRILITNDKDFGEKVYRDKKPHKGVVFLRLNDERARSKIDVLDRLIENYSSRLTDNFVVVNEDRVRIGGK